MNSEILSQLEKIFISQKEDYTYNWQKDLIDFDNEIKNRIENELMGLGPLHNLLENPSISEILVNSYDQIYYEQNGHLHQCQDRFYSDQTYRAALDRLSQSCGTYISREKPFIEIQTAHLRITQIYHEIARGQPLLCIRLQPKMRWTLNELKKNDFINSIQLTLIKQLLEHKKNFLVVGSTGTGKTSFLQALLQELPDNQRALIIEDTQELHLPNQVSASLLTRQDPSQTVSDVTMDDLLKRALRLRPDRLIVGEVRGPEAKSLLMALSSGHDGSFGSLHSRSAPEALIRLEMLIQMGASHWSLASIRKLILLTLSGIIVLERIDGKRKIKGIYKINSLEDSGFTLTQLDEDDNHDLSF